MLKIAKIGMGEESGDFNGNISFLRIGYAVGYAFGYANLSRKNEMC